MVDLATAHMQSFDPMLDSRKPGAVWFHNYKHVLHARLRGRPLPRCAESEGLDMRSIAQVCHGS